MLNNYFDRIYCINLDRRPDRWEKVKQEFNRTGIEVERFSAIDGETLQGEFTMPKGVYGCIHSHLSIIKHAKVMGYKSVFIFEDDAELHSDFNSQLLASFSQVPKDWDLLYFGGSHQLPPVKVNFNIYRAQKTLTTHAFGIRSNIYDKAIELLSEMKDPADSIFADLQKVYNAYIINPPIAWQRRDYSDIEKREMNYPWLKQSL